MKARETTTVDAYDVPKVDPFALIMKKYTQDEDPQMIEPTGGTSFEGAEYTLEFYPTYMSEEEAKAAEPTRTWVFTTNEYGIIDFSKEYQHTGGDELYYDELYNPIYPLGTYLVYETEHPAGYHLSDSSYYLQCVIDADGNARMTCDDFRSGTLPDGSYAENWVYDEEQP